MKEKILVVGATGMLGAPVARRLKDIGFQVRVVTRQTARALRLFGESFEVVESDVRDLNGLRRALDGCSGVHISLSGTVELIGVKNIVFVSKSIGIKKITYVSGTSVSEDNAWFPLIRQKLEVRRIIRKSGICYTIFCPTWFMESLSRFVKGNRAYVFGKQTKPYHFVAADDFAIMVACSYIRKDADCKRFIVHGPEKILFRDALERYCAACHPEVKHISKIPYWLSKIIARLKRSEEMKYIGNFMEFFEKVGETGDPEEANRILGVPNTTLNQWLKDNCGERLTAS